MRIQMRTDQQHLPAGYKLSPRKVPPQIMTASASFPFAAESPFSSLPASSNLSAYACIRISATQLPMAVSSVRTFSLLTSNGVKLKQTGFDKVSETVDSKSLTRLSISGAVGVAGVISWCFPDKLLTTLVLMLPAGVSSSSKTASDRSRYSRNNDLQQVQRLVIKEPSHSLLTSEISATFDKANSLVFLYSSDFGISTETFPFLCTFANIVHAAKSGIQTPVRCKNRSQLTGHDHR